MDRFETLLTAYLDGPMSSEDCSELAELVRGHLAHRKRFLFQTEMSGLLWAQHAPLTLGTTLAAQTLLCLPGAERGETAVQDVMELVRDVPKEALPPKFPEYPIAKHRWTLSPVWLAVAIVTLIFVPALWLAFSLYSGNLDPRSLAAVATLQSCSGRTELIAPLTDRREPLKAGQALLLMKGIETSGAATIQFNDDTTFTLTATELPARVWLRNTQPGNVQHRELALGKRVTIDLGSVHFDVTPQPSDAPMIVITPHAEVKVVGTVFTVVVTPATTVVTVERGEVRVTRTEDRRSTPLLAKQTVSTADEALKPVAQP